MRTIVAIGIAGALSARALRARWSGVSATPHILSVGNVRRQHQRRARARLPHHPHDRATHDLTVAALRADDRLPRRVHDLLDTPVRDVPPARGWRRLPRSRRREGSVTSL